MSSGFIYNAAVTRGFENLPTGRYYSRRVLAYPCDVARRRWGDQIMKTILLVTLLFMAIPQGQSGVVAPAVSSEGLPVTVLSVKWFKDRQTIEQTSASSPAAAMIPRTKTSNGIAGPTTLRESGIPILTRSMDAARRWIGPCRIRARLNQSMASPTGSRCATLLQSRLR